MYAHTRAHSQWYLVTWLGYEDKPPTWQNVKDVPEGSRDLINNYNARLRQEASLGGAGEGEARSSAHPLIGSEIAKDFGENCIYVGHVTGYYPPKLDRATGESDMELFHVEYKDGDEEDMGSEQLSSAMKLAQQHARATAAAACAAEAAGDGDGT